MQGIDLSLTYHFIYQLGHQNHRRLLEYSKLIFFVIIVDQEEECIDQYTLHILVWMLVAQPPLLMKNV